MSHWNETAAIVEALRRVAARGGRAALATVVSVEGSSYRRPGAKLLVVPEAADGERIGGVSGGCLENDVRAVAEAAIASGRAELRIYDSRTDEDLLWGLGTGCSGTIGVLVEPVLPGSWSGILERLAAALAGDRPFALTTPLPAEGGSAEPGSATVLDRIDGIDVPARSSIAEVGGRRRFVERFEPPVALVVCGAGDDSRPLVRLAAEAGFRVWLCDHRAPLLSAERFPEAFRRVEARPESAVDLPDAARASAVVKLHSYALDREWARKLLAAGLPFVGLLGPRARTARIRDELGAEGDPRLVGPVGLDLGADGAHEIAVSIVAQLLAVRGGRGAGALTAREESIHAGR